MQCLVNEIYVGDIKLIRNFSENIEKCQLDYTIIEPIFSLKIVRLLKIKF